MTRLTRAEKAARAAAEHQEKMIQESSQAFMNEISESIHSSIIDGIIKEYTEDETFKLIMDNLDILKVRKMFQIKHSEKIRLIALEAFNDIASSLQDVLNTLYSEEHKDEQE